MPLFTGYHYQVTDTAITATGKRETWLAESRDQAIGFALYTHSLYAVYQPHCRTVAE